MPLNCSLKLSVIEMKKIKAFMSKPLHLGLAIVNFSKREMCENWFDYIKQKYNDNVKLRYIYVHSSTIYDKIGDFYEDIQDDKAKFVITQIYQSNDHYQKGKDNDKKVKKARRTN